MKPVSSYMSEVDTLEGEEVTFRIGDPRWVMQSMADLYSNRELAVTREYSTNARDSHIEAGIADTPIKVTLPDAMNPYFTVQDFGVGLSEAELKDVYTSFGDSTKRNSDNYNGMLGFGCKSAIAYTNTFTVTSVKDNVKTVAVISRKPDYTITLKVVLTVATKEANGVTVQVPVHNWQEFAKKAQDFYRFWPTGSVEVNGKYPEWAVGEKIDDNLYYYPKEGTSYVVMGNVPYRIANPSALFPRGMREISFVAYVPNGAVEFTPSREDLKYSEHTKNSLKKIISDFVASAKSKAVTEIGACKTAWEAYAVWVRWRKVLGAAQVEDLKFNGLAFVDRFAIMGKRSDLSNGGNTYSVNNHLVSDMHNTVIVTNFNIEYASRHKAMVREWANLKGLDAGYAIFTSQSNINCPWIDPARIVDFDTLKSEIPKKPRPPRSASVMPGRKAGTFDIITSTGKLKEQDVPVQGDVYYISVQQSKGRDISGLLRSFNKNWKVVVVPENRRNKFLRCYPNAQSLMKALKKEVNLDGPSLISDDGWERLAIDWSTERALAFLDSDAIDDPTLTRLIKISFYPSSHYLADYTKQHNLARLLGLGAQFKQWQSSSNKSKYANYLQDNYPLAMNFARQHKNHVTQYINTFYKLRKEGKI